MRRLLKRLATHQDIPGYRGLSRLSRLRIDLSVGGRIVRSRGFLRLGAWTTVAWLVAMILCFEFDLAGWRSDLVRALPFFGALPWLLMERRRRLPEVLRARRNERQ